MDFVAYLIEYNRYMNLIGIFVVVGIAWLFSHNRQAIRYRLVMTALAMHVGVAFLMLKTFTGQYIVAGIARAVASLYGCAGTGAEFLFGSLAHASPPWGPLFAFQVLPVIVFFGTLMSLLFHLGVIEVLVGATARVVRPILATSGPETLVAVANSFLGQTEAPLVIRAYLKTLTKSEMFTVMVSGMATISGAILVVYASMGIPARHLLTASVMAIPASLLIAKVLYPETKKTAVYHGVSGPRQARSGNIFDAIASGMTDGLGLALNIGAALIAFIALIALVDVLLYGLSTCTAHLAFVAGASWNIPVITIKGIFACALAPCAYLLGLTHHEAHVAGELLGTKLVVNEMVAYSSLATMELSERTRAILTYALCGFANFSSIGIQMGGIGALAPERRAWLSELGLRALLGGTLVNMLSAMVAGLLL